MKIKEGEKIPSVDFFHINVSGIIINQIIEEKDLPEGSVFTPSLKPGDAAIHHTMNIHGSNPNKSGKQRRGFLICYKGKNTKRNKNLFNRYEKNLEKLIELRNS